jgi:predicted dehydrogenase
MKRCAIVGGETHIGEITALVGKKIDIEAVVVRKDQTEWATEHFDAPILDSVDSLFRDYSPDIVAIANENDRRAEVVLQALVAGCDVIADKPLSVSIEEHERIVTTLGLLKERKLLNLLTLRGTPQWRGVYDVVRNGSIGAPAFCHVRMAVRLKRSQRPPWFLDVGRSGGLFLDLLIHGLDVVEWTTGRSIVAVTASTGNLGYPDETQLRDCASVYCELAGGATAVVEGQRMLPDTKGSDYRITVAGTKGYVDMDHVSKRVHVTDVDGADREVSPLPEAVSIVEDWLDDGVIVPQNASVRANYLALMATLSAQKRERVVVES